MIKYEIKETESGEIIIRFNEDGSVSSFPTDENNADYQAYLNKDNFDYGKPNEL
jgi:hypothetical protein